MDSILVKAGAPVVVGDEVTVSEFKKKTGISKRHIQRLCEDGQIDHRRLTPKRDSKILILRSEIERYRNISSDDLEIAPNTQNCKTAAIAAGIATTAQKVSNPLSTPAALSTPSRGRAKGLPVHSGKRPPRSKPA